MKQNRKLAIAIPTYNRAAILKENIHLMLEEITRFSIPVYISDDSNNTDTEMWVKELKEKYSLIYYYKNTHSLGHDKNCIRTLGLPSEEYIWYLGDSIIICNNGISKILDIISSDDKYEFISVNIAGRVNLPEQVFYESNILLTQLGWHLTLTGATIYSKKALESINTLDLNRCRNFPQTALILNNFHSGNWRLYWINDNLIYGNSRKRSYWTSEVFNVFLIDWSNFIRNLPEEYSDLNKSYTIKLHTQKTGVFSLTSLISYRARGYFTWKILRKYKNQIIDSTDLNYYLLIIIAIFPKRILQLLKRIFKLLK